MKLFELDVVSPEGPVWSGEAEMVVAKTVDGEIGIMADHEPLMAALATGAVEITHAEGKTSVGVHGGFLQVLENHVTLLTDRARLVEGDRTEAQRLASELAEMEEDSADAGVDA